MDVAAPWVDPVVEGISLVILLVTLVVEAWAFIHCALQRADAFGAVGTLSKPIWMALLAGTALLALVLYSIAPIFGLIAVAAALVYLLDVRPAIREIANGGGRW